MWIVPGAELEDIVMSKVIFFLFWSWVAFADPDRYVVLFRLQYPDLFSFRVTVQKLFSMNMFFFLFLIFQKIKSHQMRS